MTKALSTYHFVWWKILQCIWQIPHSFKEINEDISPEQQRLGRKRRTKLKSKTVITTEGFKRKCRSLASHGWHRKMCTNPQQPCHPPLHKHTQMEAKQRLKCLRFVTEMLEIGLIWMVTVTFGGQKTCFLMDNHSKVASYFEMKKEFCKNVH